MDCWDERAVDGFVLSFFFVLVCVMDVMDMLNVLVCL